MLRNVVLWVGLVCALVCGLVGTAEIRGQDLPPLRYGADAEGGAPFIFLDSADPTKTQGFEVDLAAALAKELGREIRFNQKNYENLALYLERGEIDFVMNGLEVTGDRLERLRMSRAYYVYTLQLVGRAGEERFVTLDQLRTLGLTVGTLNETAASRLLKERGIEVAEYDSQAEPFLDLSLGRVDAVLMDLPIAEYYARPNPKLAFLGEPIAPGHYALAFRKQDEALSQQFDAALLRLAQNGELEKIYRRWNIWNDDQLELADPNLQPRVSGGVAQSMTLAKYLPLLLDGAKMTILLSVCSMALAVLIGLLVAIMRLYGPLPLKLLAVGYVEFFRGIPVLLLLYVLYFGISPLVFGLLGISLGEFERILVGIVAFGLNYAAYEAEIYRAGIGSIPQGQWEAAASLGMNKVTTFRRIILPQTWRVVLPPMTNDFVALFKDTSIVSVIAVVELTKQYQVLAKSSMKYVEIGLATAALYLLMSVPLGYLSRWMEKRLGKG
jgi:polar amino acid transport system substrate-binding protein